MKRLLTFLALCCLVVTGAWAGVTSVKTSPQNVGGVTTYYVYTFLSKVADNTYWSAPNGTLNGKCSTATTWFFEATGTNGEYYVGDYVTKKYLSYNEIGADKPVTLGDTKSAWKVETDGTYVKICPASNTGLGLNCNPNQYMYTAGSGNDRSWWTLTESTKEAAAQTYTVTFQLGAPVNDTKDVTLYDGTTPSAADLGINIPDGVTATPTPAFAEVTEDATYSIAFTDNRTLPFESSKLYNLAINRNPNLQIYVSGNDIVNYATNNTNYVEPTAETKNNYNWSITGDWYHGYTWKNVGADKYVSYGSASPADKYKATLVSTPDAGSYFDYISNNGYNYFKLHGTTNNAYISNNGGIGTTYLTNWNSTNNIGDGGAQIIITEVEEPVTPDPVTATYNLTPAAGNVEASDLAKVYIKFTGDSESFTFLKEEGEMQNYIPTLTNGAKTIHATAFAANEDTNVSGIADYVVTFPTTDISAGQWELSIPEGSFYSLDLNNLGSTLDVAEITATYTVAASSYTYDITITGVPEGKTAELSYKGAPCGEQLETSGNIKKEDFTATEIPGYNVAIYINGDQINVIYTLENHIIEVLDIVGMPEDYDRGIIVNGQRYLNNQISNVTPLVISGALEYEALPVPGYATTVELYQTTIAGQNVSGIRVKYVAQKPLAYTSATSYYVNIKSADGYLYNDRENDTKTHTNSASSTNNNYVWRVDVAEDGTMTITNGQGSHYTNESGTEKATFSAEDIETLGWTFEPVSFKYVTKILVAEEEGQGYVTLGGNQAYNNGFLLNDNVNFTGLGYGDLSENTIAPRVGAGFEYAQKSVRPVVRLTYFTQQQVEEDKPKMLDRMVYWWNHIGKVGYPTFETLGFEYDEEWKEYLPNNENEYCENFIEDFYTPLVLYMFGEFVFTTSNYLKILSVFDKVSAETNIVLPIVGEGYRLSVRTKSGEHKYLVADGKLTTDVNEASVFVLSKDEDRFFFASNDNTNLNYLTSEGEKTTAYNANSCAFTPFQMSLVNQDFTEDGDVTANPSERVGTFSLTVEGGTITLDDEDNWSLSDNAKMNDTYTSGFELEDIEYPYNKPKFAKGTPDGHAGGYASIWLPYPMKFADGVEVYKGTNVENENLLILEQVNTDEVVAAGGYILCNPGQGDDTLTQLVLPAAADPESKIEETDKNVFYGSTENPLVVKEEGSWAAFREQHPSGTPYVLAKKNGIVGYYKYTDEEYLPKGKAIWFSNYTGDAECVQFSFGDIISAIEALHGNTGDNEIFDLQGRRLDKAEKGQVNVINGKKVMFK